LGVAQMAQPSYTDKNGVFFNKHGITDRELLKEG
jgi:hypothetical protein